MCKKTSFNSLFSLREMTHSNSDTASIVTQQQLLPALVHCRQQAQAEACAEDHCDDESPYS